MSQIDTQNDSQRGILLMIGATLIFAIQDGISSHLASTYNVLMVVMIRYWFLAAFVIMIALRHKGGLRRVITTRQPILQILRGAICVIEICVMIGASPY